MTLRPVHLLTMFLVSAATSSPAIAQSTYVSAALVGDVLRTTHSESTIGPGASGGGEAIGFALRAGTPLGSVWGVEMEFTRPGEIESELASGPIPLLTRGDGVTSATLPGGVALPQIYPPIYYRVRTTQRLATLATSLWVNHYLTERVSLVYLAGMGFSRTTFESESRVDLLPIEIARPIVLPNRTKTVVYGVRPLVGIEGRIGLTEHVELVPGFRLHGLEGGWLMRPAIALGWKF